ncbi:MAG: ABC transporter substrate-binding protein [Flavobacterium sp.]|nr:ABC transporter substrate-binding protein [Flavobacterium sp.]
MKKILFLILQIAVMLQLTACKKTIITTKNSSAFKNEIKHAKGFILKNYNDYSILTVVQPWPNSQKKYTYILKAKNVILPDSLQKYMIITVPIKSIIVTSTTHIPSLEMLHQESKLVGFPNLDYISSEKIRTLLDQNKIVDVGSNNSLNTEKIIELQPEILIGYGINNSNTALDNLSKNGIKVVLNGDWNEQTPLGKAEWIKFFGALFKKQKQANQLFENIESDYKKTLAIAAKADKNPTVLAGDMFEDTWYLPKGDSWGSILIEQSRANYLFKNTRGTGSLSLSFEKVLEKAQKADFWITSGQFSSLNQMKQSNRHYEQFAAFKNKNVYSFASKKGKTGGILYYELAPNRPDIVLKDMVKILHPELLPGYVPYFFSKLQ